MTFDELEMTRGQHKKKLGYTQTIAVVLQTFSLFSPFCFISETELMLSAANSSQTQTRAREENELPQRLFASQRLSAFHTDDECDQKTSPATCGTCKSFLFFFFFWLLFIIIIGDWPTTTITCPVTQYSIATKFNFLLIKYIFYILFKFADSSKKLSDVLAEFSGTGPLSKFQPDGVNFLYLFDPFIHDVISYL